jgi:hypothetical protein
MLAAVVAAAAAVGKVDQLYRHAVAATAALELPDWQTQQGGIDGQAGYGCKTALALVRLYFGDEIDKPALRYLAQVPCGVDANNNPIYSAACYGGNLVTVDSEYLVDGKVEYEHYLCLHEASRPPPGTSVPTAR